MLAVYNRNRFGALFVTLLLVLAAGADARVDHAPLQPPRVAAGGLSLLAAIASVVLEGFARVPIAVGVAFVVVRVLPGRVRRAGIAPDQRRALGRRRRARARRRRPPRVPAAAAWTTSASSRRLDAYLLAGFLFGVAYWTLHRTESRRRSPARRPRNMGLSTSMYFSFVTIATLGYGDIVPVTAPARGLAVVEAISGQMYLAVLVARLVSLYSHQSR